jgi:hypothetical protein
VFIRLVPPENALKRVPKTKVHLKLMQADGRAARETDVEPVFQECSTMKKRRESSYENGKWGPETDFPPKERCWETTLQDPFNSDRRREGTAPLVTGDFLLAVEVTMETGTRLKFEPVSVSIYGPRGGR